MTESLVPLPRTGYWQRLQERMATATRLDRSRGLALLAVTGLVFGTPIGFLFREALADGASGFRQAIAEPIFWEAVRTTATLTAGAGVIAMTFGTVLAWFAHGLPPRRRWLGYLPLAPLVVPQLAALIGYVFVFSPRIGYGNQLLRLLPPFQADVTGPVDVYTLPWIIGLTGIALSAFVYLFVRTALSGLPQDLVDAAAVAKAGSARTFFTVVVPLLRPSLLYSALTVTLLGLGQFAAPLLLGRNESVTVLTTGMYNNMTRYPPRLGVAAAYGAPIVAIGLIFLLLQRHLLRDQSRFVTVSGRGQRPVRHTGAVPQAALALYGFATIVLPVGALVLVSLQPFWRADIAIGDLSFEHFATVFTRDDLVEAVTNSLSFAVFAVAGTLLIAYLVAIRLFRRSTAPMLGAVQDVVVAAPLGIPAVIFGAGFYLAYQAAPVQLWGQPTGIILLYITLMIPYATRLLLTSMINTGQDLADAGAVAGASRLRRWVSIELPLLRPALGSAAALVVILTTHEFAASLLVRSQDTQVIGTIMYDLWLFGSYPETAAMALVMTFITGIGVLFALAIGGGSWRESRNHG